MTPEHDLSLAPELYAELTETLRNTLPHQPHDTPQARADRDRAAIAYIASLRPADCIEVELALQVVLASAHAEHCLLLSRDPSLSAAIRSKWSTLGASLMRTSRGTLKLLLQQQKRRRKAQSTPQSERARQAERRTAAMLERAFADLRRDKKAQAERHSLEQRLSAVAPCFIHQPGDPNVLN